MSGNDPRIQTQSSMWSVSTSPAWFGLVPLGLSHTMSRHDWGVLTGKGPFPIGFCTRSLFQRRREFNNMDVSRSVLVCRMCLGECSCALLIYCLPTSFCLLRLQDSLCFVSTNESVLWQAWEEAEARHLTLETWRVRQYLALAPQQVAELALSPGAWSFILGYVVGSSSPFPKHLLLVMREYLNRTDLPGTFWAEVSPTQEWARGESKQRRCETDLSCRDRKGEELGNSWRTSAKACWAKTGQITYP